MGALWGILRGVPNIMANCEFRAFDNFWEMWSYLRRGVLAIY